MGDPVHRLAAAQAMGAAEAAEEGRRSTHEPTSGGNAGVTLDGASAEELASLGMAHPVPPDPLGIPEDWITQGGIEQ